MLQTKKILIVEDDPNISELVRHHLDKGGYDCKVLATADEAFNLIRQEDFDMIVLDIMLPGMDGFEFCKKIKQDAKLENIPIMMLTAKGEEIDRVVGFELGADDYMVKPFSTRELVLRIKAIFKRTESSSSVNENQEELQIGKIVMNLEKHKVTVDGKEVELTKLEYDLLKLFIERKGRLQSRKTLLNDVWDINADVTTRTVDTHIKKLRKKLGSEVDLIQTIHGVGYRIKDA